MCRWKIQLISITVCLASEEPALLGENYLLLLAPLACISSVKKNDVPQPSQTQPLPGPPCPHTD